MKDFLRKLLASLLCICMIGSSLPVSSIAEAAQGAATPPEQQTASGDTGEEQGGKSAQTQEIVMEPSNTVNLSDMIMPTATEDEPPFSVTLELKVGSSGSFHHTIPGETVKEGDQLYWRITIKNNTEDDLTLNMIDVMDWDGTVRESGKRVRKPKVVNPDGSSNKDYALTSSDGGSFTPPDNDHFSTIVVPHTGDKMVQLDTNLSGALKVDITVNDGGVIKNTVYVWEHDKTQADALSDSTVVTRSKDIAVTKQLMVEDGSGKFVVSDADTVEVGKKIKFRVTVTNNSTITKKIKVAGGISDVFTVNGIEETSVEKLTNTNSTTLNSDNYEIETGKNAIFESGEYTVAKAGDHLSNTVTVSGESATVSLRADGESEPDFTVTKGYVVWNNYQSGEEMPTDGFIDAPVGSIEEGQAVRYRVTVTNNSTETMHFKVSDSFMAAGTATTTGKNGEAINDFELVGDQKPYENGVLTVEAHETKVLLSKDCYVVPVNFADEHSDKATLSNVVTLEPTDGSTGDARQSGVLLLVKEPSAYTVATEYALGDSGYRSASSGKVGKNQEVKFRLRITNTSELDLKLKLSGFSFLEGSSTDNKLSTLGALNLDWASSSTTDEESIKWDGSSILELAAGQEAILQYAGSYTTSNTSSTTATYTVKVDCEELKTKIVEKTLKITNDGTNNLRFGYSLSVNGARFSGEPESDTGIVTTTDNIQLKFNGFTASDHAYKYLHNDQYKAGQTITVTTETPKAEGYTFVGWYDKNAVGTYRLVSPGATVIKDGRDEQSIDAVWMRLATDDNLFIYDGKSHTIDVASLALSGEAGKYDFNNILAQLTVPTCTYSVKGPGDINIENQEATIDRNTGKVTLPVGGSFTNVGVYNFTIKVNFPKKNETGSKFDGAELIASAKLTILPRPVAVQAGTGSHEWTNKPITIKDCADRDTGEYEYKQGSAFEDGVLSGDASAALTEKIEALSISNVDAMLKVYTSGDEGLVGTDAFTVGHTPIVGYKGDDDIVTESSKTAPGEYQSLITNKDQLATAADGTDTTNNYVFITVPGTLTIKAPTLATITLTKNVVDASFESGTFTFTATRDDTAVKFVKSSTEDNTYYEAGKSPDVPGDGDEKISLQVTANKDKPATETDPATASVTLKVTPGKYTFAETGASVTSVYSEEGKPTLGRDDYTPTYKTKDSAAEAVEDDNAEVTVEAGGEASVVVTNTAKFYFVEHYAVDLHDKYGTPIDNSKDDNELVGMPEILAKGTKGYTRFAFDRVDKWSSELTYQDVNGGFDGEEATPATFSDLGVESGNVADNGNKGNDTSDGTATKADSYKLIYDDGYSDLAKKAMAGAVLGLGANNGYLDLHKDNAGKLPAGGTVQVYWVRQLEQNLKAFDGIGVSATAKDAEEEAIRQGQATVRTHYAMYDKTTNNLYGGNSWHDTDAQKIQYRWQGINKVDVTATLNQEAVKGVTGVLYAFNAAVAKVWNNGSSKYTVFTDAVIKDTEVGVIDNAWQNSPIDLYLTPLVKVKYFIDDGKGEQKELNGNVTPYSGGEDKNEYTIAIEVKEPDTENGYTMVKNTAHATEFTPLAMPSTGRYTTTQWRLKRTAYDPGTVVTDKSVDPNGDGKLDVLQSLYMNDGKYWVDASGYLVIGLYLTEAQPSWKVTKSVKNKTFPAGTKDNTAYAGDTLQYTITVENTGNVPLENILVTDDMSFESKDNVQGPETPFARDRSVIVTSKLGKKVDYKIDETDYKKLTITQIELGDTITITYTYTVPENVKHIENTVTVDDRDEDTPDELKQTAKTKTDVRAWTVEKSVTGMTGEDKDGVAFARGGDVLKYAIKVVNTGNVDLTDLSLKDAFTIDEGDAPADALTYQSATSTGVEGKTEADFVSETKTLTKLAKGETVTITYTYTVPTDKLPKAVANTASVSADSTHTQTSDQVETKIASFTVDKKVAKQGGDPEKDIVVKVGDKLVYTITVTNTSDVVIPKLYLSDVLSDEHVGDASLPALTLSESTKTPNAADFTFTWHGEESPAYGVIENLPAGGSITLVSDAISVEDGYEHLKNTVYVDDDENTTPDGTEADQTQPKQSTAEARVKSWKVEKTVEGMSGTGWNDLDGDGKMDAEEQYAVVGNELTYKVKVTNTGDVPMVLFVKDVFAGTNFDLTEGVTFDYDPKSTPDKAPTLEEYGDEYALIENLQPNQTVTFTYKETVTDGMLGDPAYEDGIVNTVSVHAAVDPEHPDTTGPDIRESDPHDETTTPIEAWTLDKELTKVTRGSDAASGYDKPATDEDGALVYPAVRPGDVLEYTVTVTNTGSAPIAEIDVSDTLKSGEDDRTIGLPTLVAPTGVTFAGGKVRNLPAGKSAKLTYTYTVQESEGKLVNAVTATLGDKEVTKTVTTGVKAWTVTKEIQKDGVALDEDDEVAVGDQLTYVVTVKNDGSEELTDLEFTDTFTHGKDEDEDKEDGLDHLTKDEKRSTEGVEYDKDARTATIPKGGLLVLTATYTVTDSDTSLRNVFIAADTDVTEQDEVTTPVRSWTVEKTVSKAESDEGSQSNTALPGNVLYYTIKIKNTGGVTLDLNVKDILRDEVKKEDRSADLKFYPYKAANVIYAPDAHFEVTGSKLTEGVIKKLMPGATFTFHASYRVASGHTASASDEYLKNTVTVDDDDENFPPKESTAETHIKNWDVAKTIKSVVSAAGEERSAVDGAYTLRPGDKVTYEVVVTNTGDEKLTLYVEDSLFIETVGKPWTEQGVKDATNVEVTFTPSDAGATSQLFEDNSSETTRNGDCLIQIKGLPKEGKAILTYTYTVPEMNADNAELFASLVENKVFVHANEQTTDPETQPKPNHNKDIDPNDETKTPIEAWTLDKALTAVTRDGKAASGYDKPKTDEDGALVYPAVQIGDVLTYTITVENVGGTDIARLNLEDVFTRAGGKTELTAANLKKDSSSSSMDDARLLTDSATGGLYIANLLKGKKIKLTYTTTAVEEKDGTEPFINTVTVTSADGEVTAEKTVKTPVVENPAWEVTKTVDGMTSDIYDDTDSDGEGDLQDAKVEDELTYTITVKNTGNVTLDGLTLVDVFNGAGLEGDPVLTKVDTTETSAVYANGIINGLGVGETLTLVYKYTVADTDIELTNKVTVSRDGTEKSAEVRTPVDANPDWNVEKTVRYADPEKVFPTTGEVKVGEKLIYRITITNTGNTMLSGLELMDEFTGKGLTSEELLKKIKQVSPEPGTGLGKVAVYNDKDQTIDNLGVGSSIVLEYEYTVAPNDATLENLVTVSLPDSHNVMHKVTTPVEENPAYTVIKQAYKGEYKPEAKPLAKEEEVAVGDTITYRITIANTGNVKLDGLKLVDTFTGKGLTPAELMEQIKAVDKSVGSDAVYENATIDGLDVGEWIALEYAYTVAADDDTLVNAVTVSLPDGPTEETEVTTPVKETPAYTVTKLAYKGEYTPEATPLAKEEEVAVGDTITYRITIANTGNVALDKLELKDVFNGAQLDGAALELAEKMEGSSATFDGKATIKDLGVGESIVLEYAYTVDADDTALQNTVTVTHGKTEVTDEVTTPVKLEPMYTVTKQAYKGEYTPEATPLAEGDAVKAGDTLTYVITVENTGKVDLKDLKLTDAFQLNDGDALPGVSGLSQYRDEDHPSDAVFKLVSNSEARVSIPVGDKLVLTGHYLVTADDKKLVNTATVADPEDETHFDESTVTTHVSGWTVEKTVTKTVDGKEIAAGSALPGSKLTYTVKVTNTGDVTLTLYLKDVLTKDGKAEDLTLEPDDDANAETKATFADMTITGLEPGKTFTLKCEYDVPLESEEAVNQIVNTVTVDDDEKIDESSDPDDPFPPQHDEQTTNIKKWDVAKSITGVVSAKGDKREAVDGRYTLRPGDTVTYEVVVTNTGDEKLTLYVEDSLLIEKIAGAKWEDKLDDLAKNVKVTFEKENEDASWDFFADNSGEDDHDGQCLIVLQNLAAGRTATLTYAYTVPEMDEDNVELFASDVRNEVYVHANVQTGEGLKPVHEPNDPYAEASAPIEAWTLDKALTQAMRGDADVTDDILSWGYPAHLDDVLTYTITIANVGGTDIDRLNLKDTFNRAGFNQALTADELLVVPGSGMGGASLQTDAKGGLYIAGLKAGESIQLTFTATVAKTDLNKLVNTVTVTSEDEETSKTETVTTYVRDMSDWTVEKTVYDAATGEPITGTVKVGDTILYRITVTNTGNTVLDNLPLYDNQNDDLGKGFSGKGDPLKFSKNENLSAYGSSYLPNSRLIGSLLPNESIVLDSPYTVAPDDVELTNIATVFGKDSNEVKTPVEPTAPAWKVTKEVYKGEYTGEEGDVKLSDADVVAPGDALTYVITVENTGNTAIETLEVEDLFNGAPLTLNPSINLRIHVLSGTFAQGAIKDLDVGDVFKMTYSYTAAGSDAKRPDGLTNAVTATLPGEKETDTNEDHRAEVKNDVRSYSWKISKALTASSGRFGTNAVYVGDTMTYTITVTNDGLSPIENLIVEDELLVTGKVKPLLDDMRLSDDAPEGVSLTRLKDPSDPTGEKFINSVVLDKLAVGQTVKIECTYTVPEGVLYTSNSAIAYPQDHEEDAKEIPDPVDKPIYALMTLEKHWTDANGQALSDEERTKKVGNSEIKFEIWWKRRSDAEFKQMFDSNGNPYVVTLSAKRTPDWTTQVLNVPVGRSLGEDDYYLYELRERGLKNGKNMTINGHQFFLAASSGYYDSKMTYRFSFTNALLEEKETSSPTVTNPTPTPTPTPSAYVPTPGPAADAKYRVTKTAVNVPERGYYLAGETVQYSIRVQNTGMVPIDALTITDHLSGAAFTSGAGYTLTGAREATIDRLSAGASVEIYASYVVTAADAKRGSVTNTVSGDGGKGPDGRPASGNAAEAIVPTNDTTYTVTVHYVYMTDGTTAAPDDRIRRLRPGDAYRFNSPTIAEYYASMLTVNGTMPAHDVEITVYYVPEGMLPADGRGGPGLILLDEYGIPLGVGRVMLNVGDCFE